MHPDGIRRSSRRSTTKRTRCSSRSCALSSNSKAYRSEPVSEPLLTRQADRSLPHREEILARAMVESEANNLES